MGFFKWWATHAPGGPGKVAKAVAKAYSTLRRNDPSFSHEELLEAIVRQRYVMSAVKPVEQDAILAEAGTQRGHEVLNANPSGTDVRGLLTDVSSDSR